MESKELKNPLGIASVRRAAEWLDCSGSFIYKLADQGKLTLKKVGKKSYVSIDELRGLLK